MFGVRIYFTYKCTNQETCIIIYARTMKLLICVIQVSRKIAELNGFGVKSASGAIDGSSMDTC